MTHKELYTHIINWKFCLGEQDRFGDDGFVNNFFDTISYEYIGLFGLWLLKKHYLTQDKYNIFINRLSKERKFLPYTLLTGCNVNYSVFPHGIYSYNPDIKDKSTYIFSEYIIEDEKLTEDLLNFIYKDEKESKKLKQSIKRWDREGANDFDEIKLLSIDEINKNTQEDYYVEY